jgi:hypothetical protein
MMMLNTEDLSSADLQRLQRSSSFSMDLMNFIARSEIGTVAVGLTDTTASSIRR